MALPVLFEDESLVVVNKRAGLLVHRSLIAADAEEFAMQIVRDQIGQAVYTVHRLDRGTSGASIFAKSTKVARALSLQFSEGLVHKSYLAIVRGTPRADGVIDHALKEILDAKADAMASIDKPPQPARTEFANLACAEFKVCVDKFPTARYSLVRARPQTGRKHQIRRHLRHLGHPIVGDVLHGSGKHNRFFESEFGFRRMYLACTELGFSHPVTSEALVVRAPLSEDFLRVVNALGWGSCLAI
jgi:tRNA pseudouridine65 synthase